jgi:hypothetical protein
VAAIAAALLAEADRSARGSGATRTVAVPNGGASTTGTARWLDAARREALQ